MRELSLSCCLSLVLSVSLLCCYLPLSCCDLSLDHPPLSAPRCPAPLPRRLIKEEELSNALLLVLANKQDLPGACNAAEIAEEMHLYPPYISKSCYIQSCCATSGEGLHEGLDWLSSNIPETDNNQK